MICDYWNDPPDDVDEFGCPNCGEYLPEPALGAASVECEFCGTVVPLDDPLDDRGDDELAAEIADAVEYVRDLEQYERRRAEDPDRTCPHGVRAVDVCSACLVESDFAYDANRERSR